MNKLTHSGRVILSLIDRSKEENGWANVSDAVWPLVMELPYELVELNPQQEGGFVKLTHEGEIVVKWL